MHLNSEPSRCRWSRRQMVNGPVGCSSLRLFGCNFIAADDYYLNNITALIVVLFFSFTSYRCWFSLAKSRERSHHRELIELAERWNDDSTWSSEMDWGGNNTRTRQRVLMDGVNMEERDKSRASLVSAADWIKRLVFIDDVLMFH